MRFETLCYDYIILYSLTPNLNLNTLWNTNVFGLWFMIFFVNSWSWKLFLTIIKDIRISLAQKFRYFARVLVNLDFLDILLFL